MRTRSIGMLLLGLVAVAAFAQVEVAPGMAGILAAVKGGDVAAIRAAAAADPALVTKWTVSTGGPTPLELAAMTGNDAAFGALLDAIRPTLGADPNTALARMTERMLPQVAYGGSVAMGERIKALGARVGYFLPRGGREPWWPMPPTHLAAARGHVEFLRWALAQGWSPDYVAEKGETALALAAAHGRTGAVEALLAAGAKPGLAMDKGKVTPLHLASAGGYAGIVRKLLAAGAPADAPATDGTTPLGWTFAPDPAYGYDIRGWVTGARRGVVRTLDEAYECAMGAAPPDMGVCAVDYEGATDALRESGAKLPDLSLHGAPAVVVLVRGGRARLLREYFAAGGAPDLRDREGCTALMYAPSDEIVLELLAAGADAKAVSDYGRTPLHTACSGVAAAALIAMGGNVEVWTKDTGYDGQTPLIAAAAAGRHDVVKALLEAGAKPGSRSPKWSATALHYAADAEVAGLLLAAGADVEARTVPNDDTPLMWAARGGRADVAKFLITKGAAVNAATAQGATALHAVVERVDGSQEVVRVLLQYGAKATARADSGETPLHAAARNSLTEAVRLLIAGGADLSAQDRAGRVAASHAAQSGATEAARALAEAGANVNVLDVKGCGPLWYAIHYDHEDALAALLTAKGADPNAGGPDGLLLHCCMEKEQSRMEAGKLLLEHGADPNRRDGAGRTALHYAVFDAYTLASGQRPWGGKVGPTPFPPKTVAAWKKGEEWAPVLLAKGADPNAADAEGRTPLGMAAYGGLFRVCAAMVAAGGDPTIKCREGWSALDVAPNDATKKALAPVK